jgi:hypothetical protein
MGKSSKRRHAARLPERPAPTVAQPAARLRLYWREPFNWALLAGLAIFFLHASWRKWPTPLIDFGRELYLPWRIAKGALLYRDVDDNYGPLSQHLNAGAFSIFGSGMMVLVAVNLVIFAAISALIYYLVRRAWGPGAAFASAAIFIAVFGFSQFVMVADYNYAAPYAHEATHGILVCLLLVLALSLWIERPSVLRSFLVGGLAGLTAVLKPEFMLAAGLVTVTAVAIRWRFHRLPRLGELGAWAAGAALPTLGFAAYFRTREPWAQAFSHACRAWWIPGGITRFTDEPIIRSMAGLDDPWKHLTEHATATAIALAVIAGIGGAAKLADRTTGKWSRLIAAALTIGAAVWLSVSVINWLEIGRCLLGLTLIYIAATAISAMRSPKSDVNCGQAAMRLCIAVLAAALMARMVLNGRIYQYGFYQAALAGLTIPAVLLGEFPVRLRLRKWGKSVVVMGALALLAPGVIGLAARSQTMLRSEDEAVGKGRDQFYTFPQNIEPTGEIVRILSDYLGKAAKPTDTLLVLPEGAMLNYLLRMPSPVAPVFFYSPVTSGGREGAIVSDLERHPPDWVVIISRDLREYGIERYGASPGNGQQILSWVRDNYAPHVRIGGDPFDYRQHGALVLKHKAGLQK